MKTFQDFITEAIKPTRRFRVIGPKTFDELKKSPELKKYSGPNTDVFDATEVERVKKSPGENKWNAMAALYGYDNDEIACALAFVGKTGGEWICLAVNVEV